MDDKEMNDLAKTQPLPRMGTKAENRPQQMLNPQKVRELEPVKVIKPRQEYVENREDYGNARPYPSLQSRSESRKRHNGQRKMAAVLVVAGFMLAAFLGAVLSGYMSERQVRESVLAEQQEQADSQLRDADNQKQSLQQQKADLEEKYQQLLVQQKEAQSLADQLKGQKEQQAKNIQDKSAAGKALDKITGEADQQEKEVAETAVKENQARQRLEELEQSVQAAGAALNEVDTQLNNLDSVRQQAQSIKDDVSKAYNENRDTVDNVLHYAALGLESFQGLLAK